MPSGWPYSEEQWERSRRATGVRLCDRCSRRIYREGTMCRECIEEIQADEVADMVLCDELSSAPVSSYSAAQQGALSTDIDTRHQRPNEQVHPIFRDLLNTIGGSR